MVFLQFFNKRVKLVIVIIFEWELNLLHFLLQYFESSSTRKFKIQTQSFDQWILSIEMVLVLHFSLHYEICPKDLQVCNTSEIMPIYNCEIHFLRNTHTLIIFSLKRVHGVFWANSMLPGAIKQYLPKKISFIKYFMPKEL